MNKKLQIGFIFTLIALSLFSINAFNQEKSGRTFLIKKDGNEAAKVSLAKFPDRIEAVMYRDGQEKRVYTSFLETATTVVKSGKNEILRVNSKEGRIKTKDSNKLTKGTTWKQRQFEHDALTLKNLLIEDMQIFRAIRIFDSNAHTNTFELSYVIAGADDSVYLSETTNFDVKEIK